jgi:histidine triad (HIT) family protein
MSDCIFCKIASGEIPSTKVYEDDEILAFKDTNPQAPVHFLVIPKKHISSIMEVPPEDKDLPGKLLLKAQEIAKAQGLEEKGCRFVINCKEDGGQTVMHLHIHVLGGEAMGWPPFPSK